MKMMKESRLLEARGGKRWRTRLSPDILRRRRRRKVTAGWSHCRRNHSEARDVK